MGIKARRRRSFTSLATVVAAVLAAVIGAGALTAAPASATAYACQSSVRASSVTTTYINAVGRSGTQFCLPGPTVRWWGTTGSIKLNGIILTPSDGTWIVIDRVMQRVTTYDASGAIGGTVSASFPLTASISVPMGVLAQIRTCSGPAFPGGPPVCSTSAGISWDFLASPSHEVRIDTYSTPAGFTVGGLRVRGTLQLRAAAKRTIVQLYLELPNWFSSTPDSSAPITGKASMSVTNAGAAKFEGAEINVPSAYLGSVEISSLSVKYQATVPGRPNGLWTGAFILNGLPGGGKLEACCTKPYGIAFAPPSTFDYAGAIYTFGTPMLVSSGVYLSSIDASFHRNPVTIVGKAKFLFGSSPTVPAVGIDAGAMVSWGTPSQPAALKDLDPTETRTFDDFTVFATGTARLFDKTEFAKAKVLYVYPSFVELEGNFDYNIREALRLSAHAKATFNFSTWDYYVAAGARLCTGKASWIPRWARNECAGGDFVLSSKGVGGCIRWTGPDVGGYYRWNGSWRFFFYGCDVAGALAVDVKPSSVLSRATRGIQRESVSPITVTPGESGLLLAVKSSSGLPSFNLVSPTGRVIVVPGDEAAASYSLPTDVRVVLAPQRDRTLYLSIKNPAAGAWRVVPRPGTPTITSVERGVVLPDPVVTASIGSQGQGVLVNYSIRRLRGQVVEFAIRGEGVSKTVGTDSGQGGTGTVNFLADDGPAGQRRVVAIVKSYDTVRKVIPLGTYMSPGPQLPNTPTVSVQRDPLDPTALVLRWTAGAVGDRAIVRVMLSDGRTLQFTTTRASLVVRDVDGALSGTVGVRYQRGKHLGTEGLAQFGVT